MEANEFDSIPTSSPTLRIEHRRRLPHGGADAPVSALFWRTMQRPKPVSAWRIVPGGGKTVGDEKKKGHIIDFLQQKSSTDLLKLLPAEDDEVQQLSQIKSYAPQLQLLQFFLERGCIQNSADMVPDCAAVALKMIDGLMEGASVVKKNSVA